MSRTARRALPDQSRRASCSLFKVQSNRCATVLSRVIFASSANSARKNAAGLRSTGAFGLAERNAYFPGNPRRKFLSKRGLGITCSSHRTRSYARDGWIDTTVPVAGLIHSTTVHVSRCAALETSAAWSTQPGVWQGKAPSAAIAVCSRTSRARSAPRPCLPFS